MELLIIFKIKIYQNLPIFLTIQKPDRVNRLLVASFAVTIKPPPFDGSNCKCWHERLILWSTSMRLMHVIEGKPKQFTPEGGSAFDASNNLFRCCLISVLIENFVDTYI